MKRKDRALELHRQAQQYLNLLSLGKSPEQAWHEFEHLHPIMQARLQKLIRALLGPVA